MICMSNLSFYLSVRFPPICTLVITSNMNSRHRVVFSRDGFLDDFFVHSSGFSGNPKFLQTKEIYNNSLLSKLTTDARLLFNEKYPSIMFQEDFFD